MAIKKMIASIEKSLNWRAPAKFDPQEIIQTECTPETKLRIREFKATILDKATLDNDHQHYAMRSHPDIHEHISRLKKVFSGKSYLEFFHAVTIVFIRRKLNVPYCLSNFRKIWNEENEFMCSQSNSRWLISACDTIIDHFEEPDEVATAMTCSLFMNTIKLYETEKFLQQKALEGEEASQAPIAPATSPRFEDIFGKNAKAPLLFDGMSTYRVGRGGNMIKHLLSRVSARSNSRIASPILKELIKRANVHDTVFKRFREIHTEEKTLWPIDVKL